MDDRSENEPIENEAARYDLKYIGLDGNIACFGKKSVISKEWFVDFCRIQEVLISDLLFANSK